MDQSISELKGVGKRVQEQLARLGIVTVGDLVMHLPRRYEDYSQVSELASIKPGPISAKVQITSVTGRYVRRGLHITEAILSDDSGSVKAVWFNQPYRSKQLKKKQEYYVSGQYEFNNRNYSLLNPSLEKVSDLPKNTARIIPIYPETKGLKSYTLRKLLTQVDFESLEIDSGLPYDSKLTRREAIRMIHFPKSSKEIEQAQEFLAFEELFSIILAARLVRAQNESFSAFPTKFYETEIKEFVKNLPFELTDDQRRAAWQALGDMKTEKAMNRLLEGDVGSGKTVVAAMLAYNAALDGQQVAIMVPTEVLAQQHKRNFETLLKSYELEVELYSGSLKTAGKNAIRKRIASGETNIVVGTQALIQDKVDFSNLNLIIIDEQHRFGVEQRNQLVRKSKRVPHVLTMTATPIPRTLALTVFGDLDISVISQMPKGRKPTETRLVAPNSRQAVYDLIDSEVAKGRQAFIIYPLVEESDKLPAGSATESYETLRKGRLKHHKLGLIHGRLKPEQKDQTMQDFANGKLDILVSTTVIEVGVDVPNASVMVIEGAERFGLAQIHQLRGRVGRDQHQAHCIIIPSTTQHMSQRLRAVERLSDGFSLAEYDLELRGPGAVYGTSQHGELDVRFTDLSDVKAISRAQQLADDFMKSGTDLLKYPVLAAKVAKFKTITHLN